jgi:hypothetical protein
MTFNATCEELKTYSIKSGDPDFMIWNKFTATPRASLHIKHECPAEYSLIIQKCFQRGWIELTATMTERERIFMGLANE